MLFLSSIVLEPYWPRDTFVVAVNTSKVIISSGNNCVLPQEMGKNHASVLPLIVSGCSRLAAQLRTAEQNGRRDDEAQKVGTLACVPPQI